MILQILWRDKKLLDDVTGIDKDLSEELDKLESTLSFNSSFSWIGVLGDVLREESTRVLDSVFDMVNKLIIDDCNTTIFY